MDTIFRCIDTLKSWKLKANQDCLFQILLTHLPILAWSEAPWGSSLDSPSSVESRSYTSFSGSFTPQDILAPFSVNNHLYFQVSHLPKDWKVCEQDLEQTTLIQLQFSRFYCIHVSEYCIHVSLLKYSSKFVVHVFFLFNTMQCLHILKIKHLPHCIGWVGG